LKITTFDEYLVDFEPEIQERLIELHEFICNLVPEAKVTINYGIPTFVFNGNLVHFGGYKNHI